MSESPRSIVTTDGDSKFNTITTLSELWHITSCMLKIFVQLNGYVDENITANVNKQNKYN